MDSGMKKCMGSTIFPTPKFSWGFSHESVELPAQPAYVFALFRHALSSLSPS